VRHKPTLAELAEGTGASKDAIRARLRRAGVRGAVIDPRRLTYRDHAARMEPREAVEYLCCLLDDLTGDAEPMLPGLRFMENRVYQCLKRRRGRPVSCEDIMTAIYFDRDPATRKTLDVLVMRVRRHLPPSEKIETVYGFGYRLV